MRMVMMASVIAATMLFPCARRVRTAQHDYGSAIDRLEHEADRNQRAEQQRGHHPQRKARSVLPEQ